MNPSKTKLVSCPTCKTQIEWCVDNVNRPFCSERCRNMDFIAWAKEDQKIAGDSAYDNVLSESLNSSK